MNNLKNNLPIHFYNWIIVLKTLLNKHKHFCDNLFLKTILNDK